MRKFFLLLLLGSLVTLAASSQSAAKISGMVNDAEGRPVSSATISLLRLKDSSLLKVALSDKNGRYEFENIKEGNYLLNVTSVGYGKVFSSPLQLAGSDLSV